MRAWLIAVLVLIILLAVSIYVFIPGSISVSKTTFSNCTENGAIRTLKDKSKWHAWWPSAGNADTSSVFIYNSMSFHPDKSFYNGISVNIEDGILEIPSTIKIYHVGHDSNAIEWTGIIPASKNPIKRLNGYLNARKIQNTISDMLEKLTSYIGKKENVYGMSINITSTIDTLLIFTKSEYRLKPTLDDIYALIETLRIYAESKGAKQNGPPLLNLASVTSGLFQARVAIPVNKDIDGYGKIESKRMVPGNFLTTEITGGETAIQNAFIQLTLYMSDYGKNEVAIPFQVLVTNRKTESDTAKWVTKIYNPIY